MQPRSIRTNNPGAINFGPFAQKYGATGTDGRLAIFPDVETGRKAMSSLLDTYERQHGLNSVAGIIGRWAPRGVDNNSTDLYIKTVASKLGVDPKAPLTAQHRPALMDAMAAYEAGTSNIPRAGSFASPPSPTLSPAGPAMAPPQPGRTFMPEEAIQGRYRFASQLWNEPQASPHWASVLAEGLKGAGSGMLRTGAEDALASNQRMTQDAMRSAADAPDTMTMAKALLGSGVPDLGRQGMGLITQDRRDAANRAAELEQRKTLMKLQGEQELAQAQAMMPLEMRKTEETLRLKAKLEQEALNKRLETLGLTSSGAPASNPASQPAEPLSGPPNDPYLTMLSPAKSTSEEAERKQKAATALALGQEGQAAKILAGESEPKEYQTKDASLAERMIRSELDLRRVTPLDAKGNFTKYDPTGAAQRLWWDDSYWNSDNWKEYQRGAREWIAALLRKDTGAAVTDSEFKLYVPTYFPIPGDSPQVVLDKQRARMALARGLRSGSGPAFEKMFPRFDQEMRQRLAVMDPETYGDKRGSPKADAAPRATPSKSTFDDIASIPENKPFQNEDTGAVYIKRNGQVIMVSPPKANSVTLPSGEVAAP